MKIDIFSIFPLLVEGYLSGSLLGQGAKDGLLTFSVHDIRDESVGKHQDVDDAPYGGGAGMLLKPEPIFASVEKANPPRPLFYLSPSGRQFDQSFAAELASLDGFSLLCGRYEGVDERVRRHVVDEEISVGDYVLAGGEAAAFIVMEAVCRLVPGVLGNRESIVDESFTDGLLEYPQYTRPSVYNSLVVPDVLLSGDHQRIGRWRRAQSLYRTITSRPDLIEARGGLSDEDNQLLEEFPEDN